MLRHCLSKPITHSSLAFHFPVRVRKPYQLWLKEGPMTRFNNSPVFKFPNVAWSAKRPPAMQKTPVRSLGQEDPLEKGMEPTPVFFLGEFHGQRSLVGYSPWGCKESDTTKRLTHIIQLRFCDLTLEPPRNMAYDCRVFWLRKLKD